MLDRSTWVIQANSPCWSLQRFAPVVCSVCLCCLKGLWTGISTLKCAYNITRRVKPVTELGIWCVNDLKLVSDSNLSNNMETFNDIYNPKQPFHMLLAPPSTRLWTHNCCTLLRWLRK